MDIAKLRKQLGLKQSEFAQLFDVHPMTVSKWERNIVQPTPYQIGLMLEFQKAAQKKDKHENLALTLMTAGAIGALIYLLSNSKE